MPQAPRADAGLPLLFYADGYRFPDVFHLTRFLSPDAIIALEDGNEVVIVANSLEEGRARKQSRATTVFNIDAFGAKDLSAKGIGREELDATQRACEDGWSEGVDAIKRATIGKDKTLELDGEVFTAERLRAIVETRLLELGCASDGAICAPGPQAADPHMSGTGPLHAGEPIVMDIFPQHKTTRYWADMTRTVSKGEPAPEILKMYDLVKRAQDAGIKALRPGVTGRSIHEMVEDMIFAAGYDTLRPGQQHGPKTNGALPKGFIHGLGHGVGLEIHEAPSVGRAGSVPLVAGDVVTVEPGVYDPAIGGVRLEDMLVITETGSRNLTRAPRQLIV